MWSLHWNVTDVRTIDHQACKIVSENRGKHPLGSTALIYLLRADGGRGLTKVKGALELYSNTNPTMELVRKFEEHAADKGHPSLVKEATRFSEEMGVSLELVYPNPKSMCSEELNKQHTLLVLGYRCFVFHSESVLTLSVYQSFVLYCYVVVWQRG